MAKFSQYPSFQNVITILGCQFDYVRNQRKLKQLSIFKKDFSWSDNLRMEQPLTLGYVCSGNLYKGHGKRKTWTFFLLVLNVMACLYILLLRYSFTGRIAFQHILKTTRVIQTNGLNNYWILGLFIRKQPMLD